MDNHGRFHGITDEQGEEFKADFNRDGYWNYHGHKIVRQFTLDETVIVRGIAFRVRKITGKDLILRPLLRRRCRAPGRPSGPASAHAAACSASSHISTGATTTSSL